MWAEGSVDFWTEACFQLAKACLAYRSSLYLPPHPQPQISCKKLVEWRLELKCKAFHTWSWGAFHLKSSGHGSSVSHLASGALGI